MGKFTYFAYGSNMLTEWLQSPGRCPNAQPLGIAVSHGYRIAFSKRSKDESGKATLVKSAKPDDEVYGVLFEIPNEEHAALDVAEGGDYDRVCNFKVSSDCSEIEVVTYIAPPEKCDESLPPYDWYLELVVSGAKQHEMLEEYIERLRQTKQSIPDPKPDRPTRLKALAALERAGFHPKL